jgi:hypothetical protein
MVRRRRGVAYSETLLEGESCLWLGFHTKASDYQHVPISNPYFKERALNGHIGIIIEAGMFGAEVEFSVERGAVRLCLSVSELMPLTVEEAYELQKSIDEGESSVSTQTQTQTQTKQTTYPCTEKRCSFTSPSPQGLGTHRVRTHKLQPQKRGSTSIRKVAISSTKKATASASTTATPTNWKARFDAESRRYNRLSAKYNSLVQTLKKIGTQYTSV